MISHTYKLEADSSNFATGAILSQEGEDGKWHPVAFMSKSLNEVERNYEIHDKEMLAIIRSLDEWRHYLEGTKHTFQIWTDHKNLEYFMTAKKLNRRQARWSLFLSRFDFSLHHRPGKSSGKPDALSRRPDPGVVKTAMWSTRSVVEIKSFAAVESFIFVHPLQHLSDQNVRKNRRLTLPNPSSAVVSLFSSIYPPPLHELRRCIFEDA